MSVWDLTPTLKQADGRRLWREFLTHGRQAGDYLLCRKDGRLIAATYVAVTNVLPGIHVSLLVPRGTARAAVPNPTEARSVRFRK